MLENVRMKKEYEDVITRYLGVTPIEINSSLLSAQNRVRLYWSNIRTREEVNLFGKVIHTDIPQPEDRGILIKQILEGEVESRYYLAEHRVKSLLERSERQKDEGERATRCLAVRGRINPESGRNEQMAEFRQDAKTNCLTSVEKDNLIYEVGDLLRKEGDSIKIAEATQKGYVEVNPGECFNATQPNSKTRRGRKIDDGDKVATLMTKGPESLLYEGRVGGRIKIRRLTPTECARLQTIPEWYKWECPETQQYKMLGNGWTVDVIKHIFKFLYPQQ